MYAEAVRSAPPHAVQIADRWHLLRSLSEALVGILAPHHRVMDQAARAVFTKPLPLVTEVPSPHQPTRAQHAKQQRRDARFHRYETVMKLVRKGMSQREISSGLGVDRRTVRRWIRACGFPERKSTRRRSAIDEYRAFLDQRWNEGCHNAAQLWREMRDLGFHGTGGGVRQWIMRHYGRKNRSLREPIPPKPPRISPRQVVWHIMNPSEPNERYLKELFTLSPEISACAEVAWEFFRMVRTRDLAAWPKWRESASRSPLASFAKHLCRDEAAVRAALEYAWSNGLVEGNVHRLKPIKRSMYGRASFDLLRARVLSTAQSRGYEAAQADPTTSPNVPKNPKGTADSETSNYGRDASGGDFRPHLGSPYLNLRGYSAAHLSRRNRYAEDGSIDPPRRFTGRASAGN